MNKKELQKILEQHELWLSSNGSEGKRADLTNADLRGADLRGADLQAMFLQHADLRRANLTEANLQDCYISYREKPNVPFLLGNILVTEVYKPVSYWRIKTWIELKPNEMEMAELLYG